MTDTTDEQDERGCRRLGRPTIYSSELATRICDLVAQRVPVVEICAMSDMPGKDTLYRWKREIHEFSDQYARARAHRADARQDRIDEIVRKMLAGEVEPNAAKIAIDAEKWQMSKEQPRRYGDKLAVSGDPDGTPIDVVTRIEIVAAHGNTTD
jgi:hypothetical protein